VSALTFICKCGVDEQLIAVSKAGGPTLMKIAQPRSTTSVDGCSDAASYGCSHPAAGLEWVLHDRSGLLHPSPR
jgi:hypothetical protein